MARSQRQGMMYDVPECVNILFDSIRQQATNEIIEFLRKLREQVVVGFVGGSDLVKISEQLSVNGINGALFPCHQVCYL